MSSLPSPILPLVHAALARLDTAIARLETAPPPSMAASNHDAAAAELLRLREDNARLDDASRVVGERLEGIIERLQTVLGE